MTDLKNRIEAAASDMGFDDPADLLEFLRNHELVIVHAGKFDREENSYKSRALRAECRLDQIAEAIQCHLEEKP